VLSIPLKLELTFNRPHFIVCQSPLHTSLLIRLWILILSSHSLISMNMVFIQTNNYNQSLLPCSHVMDETPVSCGRVLRV